MFHVSTRVAAASIRMQQLHLWQVQELMRLRRSSLIRMPRSAILESLPDVEGTPSVPRNNVERFSTTYHFRASQPIESRLTTEAGCILKLPATDLLCYIDGLYSYAMVLARDPAMASDLVQETYLRAIRAKDGLREDSNVKSWLTAILRNIWLNQLRHLRSVPTFIALDAEETIEEVVVDKSKDPYLQYVTKSEGERVREAIRQLPPEYREIILLREYEELSYQEIATLLNCPTGTVMSRLARARSRLRERLLVGNHLQQRDALGHGSTGALGD
jgi:RNA polymerase sigma-70 factor (ECF subfamily)